MKISIETSFKHDVTSLNSRNKNKTETESFSAFI